MRKQDNFTGLTLNGQDCNHYVYPPWPPSNDCAGYLNYLDTGYPTIMSRGNQAANMANSDQWNTVCSNDQMNMISANDYAFYNEMEPSAQLDVALVVNSISQVNMTKGELCRIATVITTPPRGECQLLDWKNNYMSTLTPNVQSTLNKWISYC